MPAISACANNSSCWRYAECARPARATMPNAGASSMIPKAESVDAPGIRRSRVLAVHRAQRDRRQAASRTVPSKPRPTARTRFRKVSNPRTATKSPKDNRSIACGLSCGATVNFRPACGMSAQTAKRLASLPPAIARSGTSPDTSRSWSTSRTNAWISGGASFNVSIYALTALKHPPLRKRNSVPQCRDGTAPSVCVHS
jgi:hypothetical protein